jgi:spermidine/putrescine-binding protein
VGPASSTDVAVPASEQWAVLVAGAAVLAATAAAAAAAVPRARVVGSWGPVARPEVGVEEEVKQEQTHTASREA